MKPSVQRSGLLRSRDVAFFDKSSPSKKLGASIIVGNDQHVQLRLVELT